MSESTTVAVHTADDRLLGRLAARLAMASQFSLAQPPASAEIALVDDRMPGAARVVRRLADDDGVTCLVLSDGTDIDGLHAVMVAGARSFIAREADAAAITDGIAAVRRGVVELPATVAQALFSRRAAPAPTSTASSVDPEVIADVIARRRFEMVFQPIADLRNGHILAVEALARFTHETRHPPNVWLAMAEEVGARIALEHELLRAALAGLPQVPPSVAISVNLSPAAVVDRNLAACLEGVPLQQLILEITDHWQLDDYEPLAEALADLRAEGLRVAVDDSGQGLSSLEQIARLAPSFMKLNRSLTRNIDRDATKHALAYALASFASQVGTSVVAEGLETDAELQTLRGIGAPLGQGYLLARPQPLRELDLTAPLALPDGIAPSGAMADGPRLQLTPHAQERFRQACQATLQFLAAQHPSASFGVAHLDYARRRHRLIDAVGPSTGSLEAGSSLPLTGSLCFHMAGGRGPRACPDAAEDITYGSLEATRRHEIASYVGSPLELRDGTRVGSVFGISRAPGAFSREHLPLIDMASSVLEEVLLRETQSMSPGGVMRHLRGLAAVETLTGVLNGPALADALEDELTSRTCSGFYLGVEVDDLASLRQVYGHAVGDLLLKDIASALTSSVDQGLDAVGHIADNRFAAVLASQHNDGMIQSLLHGIRGRLAEIREARQITFSAHAGAVQLADVRDPGKAWELAFAEPQELS